MKAFGIILLLLAGCAHAPQPAATKPPVSGTGTQVIPALSPASSPAPAAFPAQYEDYYVGMIADPDDPAFAYRPGDLIVQTRPARLGLGAEGDGPPLFGNGPVTTARMANDHPQPTDTELAALVARSQRAILGLTEENGRLLVQVRELRGKAPALAAKPEAPPGKTAPPPLAARAAAPPADPGESRLNVIAPDSDYVIELDPRLLATSEPATTNPFVQLYQPPVALRELAIRVSAAVPGPNPTAVIDDEPYSVGERFKDLTVYRIDPDTVYLRKDSFLLACPVSDRLLTLRLP